MAWTTPRSWTPGETVTASIYNTHIRDEFVFLKNAADSGGQNFGTHCALKRHADQTISDITWTQIEMDTVLSDPDSWRSSDGFGIEVPATGVYLVTWGQMWNNTAVSRNSRIRIEGVAVTQGNITSTYEGWGRRGMGQVLVLTAGDVLYHEVYHNAGGDLVFEGTVSYGYSNHFTVVRYK